MSAKGGGFFSATDADSRTATGDSVDSGHNVTLYDGVKDFSVRNSGTGVAVLISDLMDKQGYESALRMLVGRRMDVFVMHVLSPEEIDPPLRGARVGIAARGRERLAKAVAEIRGGGGEVSGFAADVTEDEQVDPLIREVVSTLGPLDVLVNNVGSSTRGPPRRRRAWGTSGRPG